MSSSAPLAPAFNAPLLPVAAPMLPQQQPVPVAVAKPAEDEPTCDEIVEDRSKAAQGLIKRYRRGKLLGKGGFAKCYELISMDSGRTYAGKVVPKSTLQKSSAKKKVQHAKPSSISLASRVSSYSRPSRVFFCPASC
jgi:hypothetical protein